MSFSIAYIKDALKRIEKDFIEALTAINIELKRQGEIIDAINAERTGKKEVDPAIADRMAKMRAAKAAKQEGKK